MIDRKTVNHDNLVRTTLRDGSVVTPTPENTPVGFSYLMPFFSKKGIDNVITRFSGLGAFNAMYGSDIDTVRKYGHAGMVAQHVLAGGGVLDGCRLMPTNAVKATALVSVVISEQTVVVTPAVPAVDGVDAVGSPGDAGYKPAVAAVAAIPAVTKTGKAVKTVVDAYDLTSTSRVNFAVTTTSVKTGKMIDDLTAPIETSTPRVNGQSQPVLDANGDPIIDVAPVLDANGNPTYAKIEETIVYRKYPLFALKAKGRGSYGNNFSFKLYLDAERDGKKSIDGRRYVLDIFEKVDNGSTVKVGNAFESISFSFNQQAVAIPGSDIVDSFDVVFDEYAKTYELPVTQEYSADNFELIIDDLSEGTGVALSTEPYMIDFLRCKSIDGVPYTKLWLDAGNVDTITASVSFKGGTDGDMFDYTEVKANNVVIGTKASICRETLLNEFFKGRIDKRLFDMRIIDCGVTFDAWFPESVKQTMLTTFGESVRSDVYVFTDLGEDISELDDANTAAAGYKSTHPHGACTVHVHNGVTKDRVRNLRTTGCYDLAFAIPKLYRQEQPFTVLAGHKCGRVATMDFDFLPGVVPGDLEIQPLRDLNVLFAMNLGRETDAFYMSDSSQYDTKFSVLGSSRNLIFAGEIIRTFNKVLAKYSFHPGNAAKAIPEATKELSEILAGSYFRSDIPVEFSIIQTRNDKINKTATVSVGIQFPDVIEKWRTTITANRQPLDI